MKKLNQRQELIVGVIRDYFGKADSEEKKSATKILLWLMRRKKGIVLTDEEKEVLEVIRKNLQDKSYISLLTETATPKALNLKIFDEICEGVKK